MCGRYYRRSDKQRIAEAFRAGVADELVLAPNYNIAPSTFQPIVRQARDTDDREMVLARWGLVPFFAKSLADFKGFSTFNARAESITTSATWRGPFKTRRCIVPVDGFYEWKKLDDSSKPAKQPFAISFKSGEPMAFAGLWDAWKESPDAVDQRVWQEIRSAVAERKLGHLVGDIAPDDDPVAAIKELNPEIAASILARVDPNPRWLQSFSIVTCEANEIMAPIHTRMPVILAERDWRRWLDRDTEAPPIDLLRPFDSDAMQTDCCNPLVGNVRNNGPEMLNSA
ncbi:putative SOS response-associated peptidase YedK [Granulicella aggregans]|uniref:Abasic site processing protein n=1 Tax=Granulicella aggregans TaxID=474949 RepID=A0A7W7ZIU1_9BACT|nr:SOS response-associated peptidase [Granulicella aggregans]MBB5060668.1 putative SOS response-associated peptidase YedK [Granulicella aggregans]